MAHALNNNALVDTDTFVSYIGEQQDDATLAKDQVNFYINSASSVIEKYCSRKFIKTTGLEEVFGGDGEKDYYTRNRPIVETPTSIKIEQWDGSSWNELTAADYPRQVVLESGRVYFTEGRCFNSGQDNWRITYDYGYLFNDVATDLKLACCVLVHRSMLKAEDKEGVVSESLVDRSITLELAKLPPDVKQILDSYRNVSFG